MNSEQFNSHVEATCRRIKETLKKKGDEYAPNNDRLQNFKDGAAEWGCTDERYLMGLVTKHWLALIDFTKQLENGNDMFTAMWFEKTGDIINYMIILEAIIHERKGISYDMPKDDPQSHSE